MFRVHQHLVTAVLLFLLWPSAGWAEGNDATSSPVRVATAEVWPWGYQTPNGGLGGSLADFYQRLFELTELSYRNRLLPHRRVFRELEDGQSDFAVLFESPESNRIADLVSPVVRVRVLLAARADHDIELALGGGMAGRSVGYIRGTYYGEAFAQDQTLEKVAVQDLRQAVEMLRLGRIDALVASDQAFFNTLKELQLAPELFKLDVVIAEQRGALYFSHQSDKAHLVPRFREIIRQMELSGELAEIFRLP